ncbi:MAG: hypothetical protein ACHQ03_10790 [Candidatus Bathyarchaeia archaeon]
MSARGHVAAIAIVTLVIGLGLGIGGAYWNAYTNRPVVEYALGSSNQSYSSGEGPAYPLGPNFVAKDTGLSDIVVAVTISGVNATVSTKSNGVYSNSTTGYWVINHGTDWGNYPFYALPTPGVTSFSITISSITYSNSYGNIHSLSDFVTYTIVSQTTWMPVTPQTLTYMSISQNTYTLQS